VAGRISEWHVRLMTGWKYIRRCMPTYSNAYPKLCERRALSTGEILTRFEEDLVMMREQHSHSKPWQEKKVVGAMAANEEK
jgi:hypothetical protein